MGIGMIMRIARRTARIIGLEKTKEKMKVFVSFNPYYDKHLKYLLDAQIILLDRPIELAHWSVKKPIDKNKDKEWEEEVRTRIKNVDQVIVICGEYTDVDEINVELTIAKEEEKPYFLLWGRKGETCEKPRVAEYGDKIYKWTWGNLKILLGNTHYIPSVPLVIDKTISENLVNRLADAPYCSNEQYRDHLFGQYKLYSEVANRINSKRQTTKTFFFSINTALIGLIGYFNINDSIQSNQNFYNMMPNIGLVLNTVWFIFYCAYSGLDIPRSRIIHEIEKLLPLNLHDVEQEVVKRIPKSLFLFDTEIIIPTIFMMGYLIWYVIENR